MFITNYINYKSVQPCQCQNYQPRGKAVWIVTFVNDKKKQDENVPTFLAEGVSGTLMASQRVALLASENE